MDEFGGREWFLLGCLAQAIVLVAAHFILLLLPAERIITPREAEATTQFVHEEYQERSVRRPVNSQELSEKIVEKEVLEKKEPINWDNAQDPSFDARGYRPVIETSISDEDYPQAARRGTMPDVIVNFTLLIGTDGKVKDVRIKRIRSRGNAHKPFQKEFYAAARRLLLRTRLKSRPYTVNGKRVPFTWTSTIVFKLR